MDISNALAATNTNQSKSQSEQAFDSLVGTREDFLTILLAQLKHQDPLDPMEGTEFIDSITRLSSVEQDINQNNNLEKIVSLLEGENSQFGNPVSYLDRSVEFQSDIFHMEGGAGEFTYNLETRPEELFVIIRNASGETVYTGSGVTDIGKNGFYWDGKNNNGTLQEDGNYTVELSYKNDDGLKTVVPTYTKGVVKGANFEGSDVLLIVDGIEVKLEDVTSITSVDLEDEISG